MPRSKPRQRNGKPSKVATWLFALARLVGLDLDKLNKRRWLASAPPILLGHIAKGAKGDAGLLKALPLALAVTGLVLTGLRRPLLPIIEERIIADAVERHANS